MQKLINLSKVFHGPVCLYMLKQKYIFEYSEYT